MSKEKQILQLYADGTSQRQIATRLSVSRNRISDIVSAAKRTGEPYPELLKFSEVELYRKLFPEKAAEPVQTMPDFAKIHRELLKYGVTLTSLWEEYVDECKAAKQPPYMYSQFCKLYSDYVNKNRLTMHIRHKPGDKLMVDWAGTTFSYYDEDDAKDRKCYLFVATLPFSMYCYAEAFTDMKQESWINAHIHTYSFLGGSARLLVSDNLKTGVIRNKKYDDPVFILFST